MPSAVRAATVLPGDVQAPDRASGCFRGRIRQRRASGRRMRGLGFAGIPSIDAIAAEYVDRAAALDPFQAALAGIGGHDHEVPDLSPDGFAERAVLESTTPTALHAGQG